jgi:hypothetical protein
VKIFQIICLGVLFLNRNYAHAQMAYPGVFPGKASATERDARFLLENRAVRIVFQEVKGRVHPVSFIDKANHHTLLLDPLTWFMLEMKDGHTITGQDFSLVSGPRIRSVPAGRRSVKSPFEGGGKLISATLVSKVSGATLHWEARLMNGSNYIQQKWTFYASDSLPVSKYKMLIVPASSTIREGTVDGSPLVNGQMFFGLEHPMSEAEIHTEFADAYLPVQETLRASDSLVITTVMGATPENQLRRGYLYYIERERAHPYRAYLHYNSWYDLSWVDRKMSEDSCMDRIRTYGDSLVNKRKVPMKAFLFDDGWDNDSTLWQVSNRFPEGFTNMHRLANTYGAELGLWISPWGGYDPAQSRRLQYGRIQHPPFETNANGFSLAGPVYYKRFEEVTTRFMEKDGVSIFKFDGVGAGNGAAGAGLAYQKDIEALLRLTKKLRKANPDLYLSLTVGTWPSPYWLFYGDAIWRAGSDFGLRGEGTKRQQWITYRDAESYKNVVLRAPLYPLNSVMLHGINISKVGYPARLEMDFAGIADGIWSFFGSGTSLQELYVNPHLLTPAMWDCLAQAANWAQKNADVLQDVHWIGGDPSKGEVYGYAAWSPRKGVITLRNPSSQPRTFELDIQKIFELPQGAPGNYQLEDARTGDTGSSALRVGKDHPMQVTLAPYELKVWDAIRQGTL